jgi:hypothetical protein
MNEQTKTPPTAYDMACAQLRGMGVTDQAIRRGKHIANEFFDGRGYKGQRAVERHLSEAQVIAMGAIAYQSGCDSKSSIEAACEGMAEALSGTCTWLEGWADPGSATDALRNARAALSSYRSMKEAAK